MDWMYRSSVDNYKKCKSFKSNASKTEGSSVMEGRPPPIEMEQRVLLGWYGKLGVAATQLQKRKTCFQPAPLLRQVLELLLGSGWLSVGWGEVRQQWSGRSSAAKCWLPVLSAASPAAVWPHRKPGRGTSVVLEQCSICDTQRSDPAPVTHRGVVSHCNQELLDRVGQLLWPAPPHLRCSNVFPVTTRSVATKASTRLRLTFLRDNVTKAHFWLWSVGAGGHSVTCRRKERVQLVDNHDQWPTIDHWSGSVDREPRCKEDLCLIIARDPSEKSKLTNPGMVYLPPWWPASWSWHHGWNWLTNPSKWPPVILSSDQEL